MAWNQSTSESKPKAVKKPSALRGLVAGLAAVAVAAVAFVLLTGKDEKPAAKPSAKKGDLIKEVQPAAASTNKLVAVKKKKAKCLWDVSETNGFTRNEQRAWEIMHRPRPAVLPKANYRKSPCEIFAHHSENAIARMLTHEPGKGVIGTPVFGPAFEKDFLDSCNEPIIVEESDGEYEKSLKKLMTETKIELRQRMANGESLSTIMMDTHKDLQRLGLVKQSIERDMRQMIVDSAETDADIDACFDAANKLLEQKGIAPMKSNTMLRRSFYQAIAKKAKSSSNTVIPQNNSKKESK